MQAAVLIACALAVIWIGWRLSSRKAVLPCPSGLAWLVEMENPLARATRSAQVVRQLAPQPGARVMDIGCGPGRVTIPLARAVGSSGEVLALDVQAAMLARVSRKAREAGLENIHLLESEVKPGIVPDDSLDGAVAVMVLGEIPKKADVFAFVFSALKPGARLVVAECIFDPHFVSRRTVRTEAAAAGLVEKGLAGNFFGYGMVFEKPN